MTIFLKIYCVFIFCHVFKISQNKENLTKLGLDPTCFPNHSEKLLYLSKNYFLKKDISQIILLNSEPKMFCKKAFLRNFRTSTEKDFCSSSLFIKVACLECLIFSIFKT